MLITIEEFMDRIQGEHVLNIEGKNFFKEGNPHKYPEDKSTITTAKFFNDLQEEISGVLENIGWELDPKDNHQLSKSIHHIVNSAAEVILFSLHSRLEKLQHNAKSKDWVPLPNSLEGCKNEFKK